MSDSTELGGKLTVTLHVDLVWTDLNDFREHFESELGRPDASIYRYWGATHWLFGWAPYRVALVWKGEIYEPFPGWQLRSTEVKDYVHMFLDMRGTVGVTYSILSGLLDGETKAPSLCYINAVRYRRDRLRIVVSEDGETPAYGARIHKWLAGRWGKDGIKESQSESVPKMELIGDKPHLPGRAKPEEWFNWFDWYYRQPWGPVRSKMEHMAILSGKSVGQVENMHANYLAAGCAARWPRVGISVKPVSK